MEWTEISPRGVGPIEQGTISNNRANVFPGPNNSGKSIASRVIYGLMQLGESGLAGFSTWLRMYDLDSEAVNPRLGPILIEERRH